MHATKKPTRSFILALIVTLLLVTPVFAGGESGTTTVTFFGEEYQGDTDAMAAVMLGKVRPTVAAADANEFFDTSAYTNMHPQKCFGVVEDRPWGQMLLETKFMTQRVDGRYNAVTPGEGQHGDWPPHLIIFDVQADRDLGCDELVAEISYRLRYTPKADTTLTYSFQLDAKTLAQEYPVMSSGGDLGLFISSRTPITVNGELLSGTACHDCPSHTRAVTTTIGAGLYTPADVEWFGDVSENSVPGLTQMYVLPVPKVANQKWNVTIEAEEGAEIWIWFGRFDMPK